MFNVKISRPQVFILKFIFRTLKTLEKFSQVGELPLPDVLTRRNVVLSVREPPCRAICLANLTAIKGKIQKGQKNPTVGIAYLHENFKQLSFEVVLNFTQFTKAKYSC